MDHVGNTASGSSSIIVSCRLRREHYFPVSPLVHVRNLLPSNGCCLQSNYLGTGLHAAVFYPCRAWGFILNLCWMAPGTLISPSNTFHLFSCCLTPLSFYHPVMTASRIRMLTPLLAHINMLPDRLSVTTNSQV
jgi:hypothetical protein